MPRLVIAPAATAVTAAAMLLLCVGALPVSASPLLYEPFNHPIGDDLAGKVAPNGQPWSPMSVNPDDDDIIIASTNLSVPGLAPAQGNSILYQGTGKTERLAIGSSPVTSGTLYYSL